MPLTIARRGGDTISNQDKIRYLRRYRDGLPEIVRLNGEIEAWRSQAERITPGYAQAGGGTSAHIQGAVEKICELQDELAEDLVHQVTLRREIERDIDSLPEERLRILLRYRYIDGWTWERIAVGMNYAYRQVTRLHGKALQLLKMS